MADLILTRPNSVLMVDDYWYPREPVSEKQSVSVCLELRHDDDVYFSLSREEVRKLIDHLIRLLGESTCGT